MPCFSSKHSHINQAINRLREDFHLSIVCILGTVIAVAVTPFALYRAAQGQWVIFLIDAVLIVLAIGIASYAWVSHKSEKAALLMATTICFVFSFTAFKNAAVSPYWLYCIVLFSFSLVQPRHAIILSLFSFCAVIIQPSLFEHSVYKNTFIATFASTTLFSYIFAKRNEYHRKALSLMAKTDALTNIGNRRSFTEQFNLALLAKRQQALPSVLAIFDVDHFKSINDTYGHDVGDRALIKITALIRNNIRAQDEVFRMGGEEFCVLIENIDLDIAKSSVDRLRNTLSQSQIIEQKTITISAGVTHISADDTLASCLKRADNALYKAKQSGRNKTVFYEGLNG